MGNKKKQKRPKPAQKISPLQQINDPKQAAAIQKVVSQLVKPPETLGQHIQRLGVKAYSVDVEGKPCIAIEVDSLVRTEMNELIQHHNKQTEGLINGSVSSGSTKSVGGQAIRERAAKQQQKLDLDTIRRIAEQQEARKSAGSMQPHMFGSSRDEHSEDDDEWGVSKVQG